MNVNDNNYYNQPNTNNIQPNLNNQQMNNNFQFPSQQKEMKKNNLLLIIPIVLILLIVGITCWYLFIFKNPVNVYKNYVKAGINKAFDLYYTNDNKYDVGFKISANVKLKDTIIDESILDLVNNTSIGINVQADKKAEKLVYKLSSKYKNDNLLNAAIFIDNKDQKSYVYLKDFLDKYIELDLDDYTSIASILEGETIIQKANQNTAKKILIDELSNIVSQENAYKEDDKYTFTMTDKEYKEKMAEIIKNLSNSEKFLNCFEKPDEIKSTLKDIVEEISNMEVSNETIKIIITKKGLLQKVINVEIVYTEMNLIFDINNEIVNYTVNVSNDKVLDGTIKLIKEKNTNKVEWFLNIPDIGSITLNLESTYVKNKDIDSIDASKTTKELSEQDQEKLLENLENSKLYEIVTELVGGFVGNDSEWGNDDDFDFGFDDEDDFDFGEDENSNQIISYDGRHIVDFEVPSDYKNTYNSDSYKSYENDNTEVNIMFRTVDDEDECLKSLDNRVNYDKKYDYYENINLSNKKTLNINGVNYYYKDYSYNYIGVISNINYYEKYLCTELEDGTYYVVEVSSKDREISKQDLNKFLSIN